MVRVRPSTSSPPGTRSRRQTETKQQPQAKKRLSNGFSNSTSPSSLTTTNKARVKYDQITTRSRAASTNDADSKRKRRELQLHNNSIIINNNSTHNNLISSSNSATGAELKRLHISMRLKHEKVDHSSDSSAKSHNSVVNCQNKSKGLLSSTRNTTNNCNTINASVKNGLRKSNKSNLSPPRSKNENKLTYRQQVLNSYSRKRKVSRLSGDRKRQRSSETDDDFDTTDSENRDRKNRRSALWVLNCEAEEFLFGETAAEKHEVVLPPKSAQPSAKRRRMRATELGELLKETPLLETKLRKPVSSGSESSPISPVSYSIAEKAQPKKKGVKRRILQSDDTSENSSSSLNYYDTSELMSSTTTSCTSPSFTSSSSCVGSPRSIPPPDYFSQSVRLQKILQNLEFRFAFEHVPSNEVWYQTFSRQETPNKPFQPVESPVVLPYERSSLSKRALGRFSKLPRKSPRCHASTLAIMSSLKPRGPGRPPLNLAASLPISSLPQPCSSSSCTPVSSRSLNSTNLSNASQIQPKQCSTGRLFGQNVSTSKRHRNLSNSATQSSPKVLQNSMSSCELQATQYVWDAMEFLEDPYVLQLLAEEENPRPPISIKSIKSTSPTTRSSHKTISGTEKLQNGKSKHALSLNKQTVPSPKTSPKMQNGSHASKINGIDKELLLIGLGRNSRSPRSPPSSPKLASSSSSRGSSRPSSPPSRPTSPPCYRKSSRKQPNQPIVLIADILRNRLRSSSSNGAFNYEEQEEVLFLSGDWLPPLPSI